jgi:hypothetical protein
MELKTAIQQRSATPLNGQSNKRSSPMRARMPIHDLQRTIGNSATTRLFNGALLQPKLTVSDPGDEYEREADRVADHVMRMPDPTSGPPLLNGAIQRKCSCDASGDESCKCM